MTEYIATFFAHFGAVRFLRLARTADPGAALQPVPRALSSSCGSCVRYRSAEPQLPGAKQDEIEQIVRAEDYQVLYRAENA